MLYSLFLDFFFFLKALDENNISHPLWSHNDLAGHGIDLV